MRFLDKPPSAVFSHERKQEQQDNHRRAAQGPCSAVQLCRVLKQPGMISSEMRRRWPQLRGDAQIRMPRSIQTAISTLQADDSVF